MVTTAKKLTIGVLFLFITTTLIVINNLEHGIKIEISKNESKFYIFENSSSVFSGNWTLSGIESWTIYLNNKSYKPSSVSIKNTVLKNNKTEITRTIKYTTKNITIIDKYLFDGNEKDIQLFPIDHNISINCTNCTYKYTYQIFSTRMKINFESPDISQTNNLFYNVNNYRTIKIRMFDPIWNVSGNISYNVPSIDPIPAYSNSTLNCSMYADMKNFTSIVFGNGSNNTVNYTVNYTSYFWYFKNGILMSKYNSFSYYNITNTTVPIIIYSPTVVTEPLKERDVWHCRIRMTTTNGIIYTSPILISNYLNISNYNPIITLISPVNTSEVPAVVDKSLDSVPTLIWRGTDVSNDTLRYEVYGG